MDPISISASILTMLAAAGGCCQFLHNLFIDVADAPSDIRAQIVQLKCLYRTIKHLLQIYTDLPENIQVDGDIHRSIEEFTREILHIKAKIAGKDTFWKGGRGLLILERLRWLYSDRQLRKFFASLEHWTIVLSQAVLASQLTLLKQIAKDTSTLVKSPRQEMSEQIVFVDSLAVADAGAAESKEAYFGGRPSIHEYKSSTIPTKSIEPRLTKRLATFLSTFAEPVNLRLQSWYQFKLPGLALDFRSGQTIVKSWSQNGREVYSALSRSEGYSLSLIIQHDRFIPGRISITCFGIYKLWYPSQLNFRFNLRIARVLPFDSPFFQAIHRGHADYLKQGLRNGKLRISDTSPLGDSLLYVAAYWNQRDIVSLLIAAGADVNASNDFGETPLHITAKQGQDYEIARLLVSNGADLCRQDLDGRTVLHTFFNHVTRHLIHFHWEDIDPWIQDDRGMTAMHYVSKSSKSSPEDIRFCTELDSSKASVFDLKDDQGRSVLHYAAQRGNIPLLDALLHRPQSTTLAMPDFSARTLLHYATESSRVDTIDLLLKRGFDLYATDDNGRTVLHHAAMRGNVATIQRLLDLGAEYQLTALDLDGCTPLQVAAWFEAKNVVEFLQPLCDPQTLTSPVELKRKNAMKREIKGKWKWKRFRNQPSHYILLETAFVFVVLLLMLFIFLINKVRTFL